MYITEKQKLLILKFYLTLVIPRNQIIHIFCTESYTRRKHENAHNVFSETFHKNL